MKLPSLLLLCLAAPLWAQVGRPEATQNTGADLTPALLAPELWSGGQLPGRWVSMSGGTGKSSQTLTTLGPIFGVVPQEVQAYFESGALKRIEVVWLEAGHYFGFRKSEEIKAGITANMNSAERNQALRESAALVRQENVAMAQKQREFVALFQEDKRAIPAAITTQLKQPGKRISLGDTAQLRSLVTEWTAEKVNLRFTADENQLISLTIQPGEDATRKLGAGPGGSSLRQNAKDAVQTMPNGDVVITKIPMSNQGDRGYCAMGTLAMVTQFYGLNLNIDQLASKAGYKEGDTSNAQAIPTYQAAAREARLRFSQSQKFDFNYVERNIEKGHPIIIWRYFSRERDAVHSAFAERFASDANAVLPNPVTDHADKASWPTRNVGSHASLINGFNKNRHEVIFTESWGDSYRNRRMRAEEMEATTELLFLLEP